MSKIETVLNECIERMQAGETIEQCLNSYPEDAAELESLLRTVVLFGRAAAVQPRPEFRAYAKAQVLLSVRTRTMPKRATQGWSMFRRGWVAAAASAFVIVISGSGTVLASSNSLPGDTLYPVKRTVEKAQLVLTPSDVGKAKLLANFADRRVKEMGDMVAAGRGNDLEMASDTMEEDLGRIRDTIGPARSAEKAGNAPGLLKKELSQATAVLPAAAPPAALATAGAFEITVTTPAQDGKAAASVPAKEPEQDMKKAKSPEDVRRALRQSAERQKKYLEGLLEKASDKDKPAIKRALERLSQAYEDASEEDEDDK
ncbi:MAG: hypothetical protein HYX90_08220 [Chloroflexi bacterium]|nr:hypothetical protein [Chloroflexota bacterium]